MWKTRNKFLDEFYEAPSPEMLQAEPLAEIEPRGAAYLAAAAEYLSSFYKFSQPAWVEDEGYFF